MNLTTLDTIFLHLGVHTQEKEAVVVLLRPEGKIYYENAVQGLVQHLEAETAYDNWLNLYPNHPVFVNLSGAIKKYVLRKSRVVCKNMLTKLSNENPKLFADAGFEDNEHRHERLKLKPWHEDENGFLVQEYVEKTS